VLLLHAVRERKAGRRKEKKTEKRKEGKEKKQRKKGKISNLKISEKIKDNLWSWSKIIFVKERYMPNYK
jgi:hypothetical protein